MEYVTLRTADGASFEAYEAGEGNTGGGIVLLQEIFGINAFVKSAVKRLAEDGYHVVAPDLFWRQEPHVELDPEESLDRQRAMGLMQGLDTDLAMADVATTIDYLRSKGGNARVGAVGYCLGGKLAFLAAAKCEVDAAVSYYGVAIQSMLGLMPSIRAPLLLHVAEQDQLCPPEAQAEIAAAAEGSALVTLARYPEVGHGFARSGSSVFVDSAAADANARTAQFLKQHLSA